ncbi:MAG: hypothetical protein AB1497_08135 [Bacillota bacterium]
MRWLGEEKDLVEEGLFYTHRDLFTELSLVFFDTTSLYFEGKGGETLGQLGHSKHGRSDHRQVVVRALLTQDGRPVSCEVLPGNQTDVKALLPILFSCSSSATRMASRSLLGFQWVIADHVTPLSNKHLFVVNGPIPSSPGEYLFSYLFHQARLRTEDVFHTPLFKPIYHFLAKPLLLTMASNVPASSSTVNPAFQA